MSVQRTEMEIMARKLYRDHKKVIDFVTEHGAASDFAAAARTIFGDNPKRLIDMREVGGLQLFFGTMSNTSVTFMPKIWYDALQKSSDNWAGCQKWFLARIIHQV